MAHLMKICGNCGAYSLRQACPRCNSPTRSAHPMKYSKEDRYAAYRRKALYPELF